MEPQITSSLSALLSAAARAAHLHVDPAPYVLVDHQAEPLSTAGLPADASPLTYQLEAPEEPVLAAARVATLARSRFADDVHRESGLNQHIVLGAGLDTSGHRAPAGARTWLVDLPGVLRWRAARFAAAGITDVGTPVPADLVSDDVVASLVRAGLEPERPAMVAWLGTTMYLDPAQVEAVLRRLAQLAPGSRLVLDHVLPPSDRDAAGRAYAEAVATMVGATGEPWRSSFSVRQIEALLDVTGWRLRRSEDEHACLPVGSGCRGARAQRLVRLVEAGR